MKAQWTILIATAALSVACGAMADPGRAILSKAKSTSPRGDIATTVLNNGDIQAVVSDAGHDTYVSIKQIGHSAAVVTSSDGISQTSTVVDMGAAADWRRSHSSQAYNIDNMKMLLNSKRTIAFGGDAPHPAAAGCAPELQTLLDAADSAVSACAGGAGLVCASALLDYNKAKSAHNSCINNTQTGSH